VTHNNPLIIADIGGTYARIALVDSFATPPQISQPVRYETARTTFTEAMADFLARNQMHAPNSLHVRVAVAAPVHPNQRNGGIAVHLTNNAWLIGKAQLAGLAAYIEMEIVNDFAAVAMVLPHLAASETTLFSKPVSDVLNDQPSVAQTKLAIGPGTGLGVAAITPFGNQWLTVPGEGGHVTLGATSKRELAIIEFARQRFDHISAERLLSGSGLPLLYQGVCAVDGVAANAVSAAEITDAARAGDRAALATLQTFATLFGRITADLTLTVGALGGVYLAGGLIQRWQSLFPVDVFIDAFLDKGRFRPYLQQISVHRIDLDEPGLTGLARSSVTIAP
jgi:glucokinase